MILKYVNIYTEEHALKAMKYLIPIAKCDLFLYSTFIYPSKKVGQHQYKLLKICNLLNVKILHST